MKLYYKPGACSLASHIALKEAGVSADIEKVDTKEQKTESGEDYAAVNPNGYVPALKLDSGEVLTEGPAILSYIAETNPAAKLSATDALGRARVNEYLSFVGSELHKAFSPFFGASPLEGKAREDAEAKLNKRMNHIESLLADGRAYLLGDQFTIADAYLFVVANWTRFVKIDIDQWPHVAEFVRRVAARPAAQAAMKAEGLI